jgi:hypothetical protein
MPVEVKKLVIQAKVADRTTPTPSGNMTPEKSTLSEEEMEKIVAACVRQVFKILNREKGR